MIGTKNRSYRTLLQKLVVSTNITVFNKETLYPREPFRIYSTSLCLHIQYTALFTCIHYTYCIFIRNFLATILYSSSSEMTDWTALDWGRSVPRHFPAGCNNRISGKINKWFFLNRGQKLTSNGNAYMYAADYFAEQNVM